MVSQRTYVNHVLSTKEFSVGVVQIQNSLDTPLCFGLSVFDKLVESFDFDWVVSHHLWIKHSSHQQELLFESVHDSKEVALLGI